MTKINITAFYEGSTHWTCANLEEDLHLFKATDNKLYAIRSSEFPRIHEFYRGGEEFNIYGEVHSETKYKGQEFTVLKNAVVSAKID